MGRVDIAIKKKDKKRKTKRIPKTLSRGKKASI